METYFKWKLYDEYIIPLAAIILVVVVFLINAGIVSVGYWRKSKLLKTNGFICKEETMPFRNKRCYVWRRDGDGVKFTDNEVARMKYAELAKKLGV